MDGFSVISERNNGHQIFRHIGELDIATAPILESALDGIDARIIFDCADLEFVDSSGLRIFSTVASNGGATLRNVIDTLRVLQLACLDSLSED